MRLLLLLVFLSLLPGFALPADPAAAEQLFGEGNDLFERGEIPEAVSRYRAAVETGYASAAVYYNLGNAFLYQHAYPEAILHYLRARRLDAGDERIMHNLYIAQQRLNVRPVALASHPAERLAAGISRTVGLTGMLLVFYAVFLGVIASLAAAVWNGRMTPWIRRVLYVLIPFLIAVGILAFYSHATSARSMGVVMTDVDQRSEHARQSQPDSPVAPGTIVHILNRDGSLIRIRLPDQSERWLLARVVSEV